MRGLLVCVLMACGGGTDSSTSTDPSSHGPTLYAPKPGETGVWGLGECSYRCDSHKESLINDFGAMNVECWSPELFFANSFIACDCVFQKKWAVSLTLEHHACP